MRVAAEGAPPVPTQPVATGALRVALLNPCYWPEVRRGAERMVRELADGLIARGHSVRLITSHPGMPSRTVEDGMEVLRLWRPPDGRLRRRWYEDYMTHAPFSYLALRAGRDDVAHALSAPDAVAAGRWARRSESGVSVFSYMGIPTRRFLLARRRRLDAIASACRLCDAVVALGSAAASEFWEQLGVRARIINPGVDVGRFTPGGLRAEHPTVFCNASLEVGYKRVDLLLKAMPLVRRERADARLILVRPRDEALAARLERDRDWLELISAAPGEDDALLLDSYRRAWVSALPSLGEAFGLVLVESLACGTPVVGTNAGGIPEVIDRAGIGRLFDGDQRELARALLEAIELGEDPATAPACRTRAQELSSERAAVAYETLYRELGAGA